PHSPDAGSNFGFHFGHHDDRLLPVVRRAVCDDSGWSAAQYDERRSSHVRGRIPLVANGIRRIDRVRSLHRDPGHDHLAIPLAARARMSSRESVMDSARQRERIARVVLYILLVLGAFLAILPMVWMVSA